MNYLAHSLLAFGNDEVLVGQFAGDFVRGSDLGAHSRSVADGIRLHRHVDAFTDRSPGMAPLRRRFPAHLRRFAGIAIDVAADYHLALNWREHATEHSMSTLAEHAQSVDKVLTDHRSVLPSGLVRLADAMREQRLLERWATREGVEQTLLRLSRRAPVFAPLSECSAVLWSLDDEVAEFVAVLWPNLLASTREHYQRLEAGHD